MKNYKAKTVDEYIASSEPEARPIMEELRKLIKSNIPKVEEGISWGVPFYKHQGLLGGFAVFKNHVSFGLAFVIDSKNREAFEEKGYKTGSKTVQIKFDQKVPTSIIKRIIKTKAKANEVQKNKFINY